MLTLLSLVALVGSLYSATFSVKLSDLHYHDGPVPSVPIKAPGIKAGDKIIVKDLGVCAGTRGRETHRNTSGPNSDRFPFNGCTIKAEQVKKYEDNNCDGKSILNSLYFYESDVPGFFSVTNVQNHTYNGVTYRRVDLSPNQISYRQTLKVSGSISDYYCNQTNASGNTWQATLIASTSTTDSSNSCPYATDKSCRNCAWPYVAKADTLNCGCKIDYSAYQPKADLEAYAYAYCNTAGNDGTQHQFDRSRSNTDASLGEIYAACTSAWSRNTVYIPAGTCPAPRIDTSIIQAGEQPITNPVKPSLNIGSGGAGTDTGAHSRLDTIIGQFRNLQQYLDTVGAGADTGILWRERDSALSGLDTVTNGFADLEDAIATNTIRGDTSGYNGYTLDSALDLRFEWDGQQYALSNEISYQWLVTSVKWIIRTCLFIWGILMFWMFLSLAKGSD